MRLFGKVDGTIDRFDRAGWLTPPFDMAFSSTAYQAAVPLFAKSRLRHDLNIKSTLRTDLAMTSTLRTDLAITSVFRKR
jgi:hypothetical protein